MYLLASGGGNSPSTPALGGGGNDEEELANVMHRNQQVSSTAIERANKDAEEGDINGALDTLRMAINIIKQSSVASMDSTQVRYYIYSQSTCKDVFTSSSSLCTHCTPNRC